MTKDNNRQLVLSVMPDRSVCPEWKKIRGNIFLKQEKTEIKIHQTMMDEPDTWLFTLAIQAFDHGFSPSLEYFLSFAVAFIHTLLKTPELEILRESVRVEIPRGFIKKHIQDRPAMAGAEYITPGMLENIWQNLNRTFTVKIKDFQGSVFEFFQTANPDLHPAGRVFFHLVENRESHVPFAFIATYSAGMGTNGKPQHLPLKHALESHDDEELLDLMFTVYKAAEKSQLVEELIQDGEIFHPLAWESDAAFTFLKEIPLYEDSGIICRIPDWWKLSAAPARINVSLGDKPPANLGLGAILDFSVSVCLGGIQLSRDEVQTILDQSQGLVLIKNKWVAVDHDKLAQALEAMNRFETLDGSGVSLSEAMRSRLTPRKLGEISSKAVDISISNGQWLESVSQQMKHPEKLRPLSPGKGFNARLRPYQSQGLNWLNFLAHHRFGACLADDMGLGKTVQILALLSTFARAENRTVSLLVVPASLISNWTDEIQRFLPSLRIFVAHPGFSKSKTKDLNPGKQKLNRLDLVITSYTLVKKYEWLQKYTWNSLIIDEAQAIKNPGTAQTRAVKSLTAIHRIAMTGTPVENRLSDLWSLFDFLNPGLLGNKTEFSRFAKGLKKDPKGYRRLRELTAPYILRRLKTDKTVISDLPDKVEMKTFAYLSKKQVVLYQKAVTDLARKMENTEGIQRKGLILGALTRFKQLCNHPDQLTGSGTFKESSSGKFIQLRRICETIYEKRERVLVFTQFKEMTEPLRQFLAQIFNHPGLVLHGAVPVAKRKNLVDTFQAEAYCPFMVLSLKAGGTGLNLTRAGHVIHFDRWWNPAVENQATDRAFRIGQTQKVLVHAFITRGTIEEKIDKMLMEKQNLADQLVAPSGESLLTQMGDEKLMEFFKFSDNLI